MTLLCINYLYIHVPPCYSWISGWLPNSIQLKLDPKQETIDIHPIDIDFNTGIVRISARDIDYELKWNSPLMDTIPYQKYNGDDKMEIIEVMWPGIYRQELRDRYYHRLTIKCIENLCDFGVGIKTPFRMYLLCINVCDNILIVTEEKDEMKSGLKCVEFNKMECNDVSLSMDLIYPELRVTEAIFYFNDKQIYSIQTGRGMSYEGAYYHSIFVFDTNKSRKDVSKFQITTCCLQKCLKSGDQRIVKI